MYHKPDWQKLAGEGPVVFRWRYSSGMTEKMALVIPAPDYLGCGRWWVVMARLGEIEGGPTDWEGVMCKLDTLSFGNLDKLEAEAIPAGK